MGAAQQNRALTDDKFKELIIYIAEKSKKDGSFGSTKLNKLLFYADFTAYARTGTSITGQPYFRRTFGPCPKRLKPVQDSLQRAGDIVIESVHFGGTRQNRILPRRSANIALFSEIELSIVDEMLKLFKGKTGTEMSNLSHQFLGWRLARKDEEIPYETCLIRPAKNVTEEQRERGLEALEAFGKRRHCG